MTHLYESGSCGLNTQPRTQWRPIVLASAYRPRCIRPKGFHNCASPPLSQVKALRSVERNKRTDSCKWELTSHFENQRKRFGPIRLKEGQGTFCEAMINENNSRTCWCWSFNELCGVPLSPKRLPNRNFREQKNKKKWFQPWTSHFSPSDSGSATTDMDGGIPPSASVNVTLASSLSSVPSAPTWLLLESDTLR